MSLSSGPTQTTGAWSARLERIGALGAFLFAFFALLGISVAEAGLSLLLLAFLARFRGWRRLGRDPVAVLCLLLVLYLALHSLVFYRIVPGQEMARDVLETGASWTKLVLLIPFAYWAGGDPDRIRSLFLLALLGFTLGFLRKIDWENFGADFFHTRFEDYLPTNAFGMFAGLGILGLMVLRKPFWGEGRGPWTRRSRILLWVLLLAILAEGFMLSFSRGSWLAFLVSSALLLWLAPGRRAAAAPLILAALLALLAFAHWDEIEPRLIGEGPVVARALEGDLDGLQYSSIGIRLLGWRYGWEQWRRHPWFGLGAGTSRHRIAAGDHPELMMYDEYWMPHLHNTYLEILYQLGLVGLALFAALLWALIRSLLRERRAGRVPDDLARFLLGTLVFVLVWNLFEYRAVRHDWQFFWILFAGAAYSFRLRTLLQGAGRSVPRGMPGPPS